MADGETLKIKVQVDSHDASNSLSDVLSTVKALQKEANGKGIQHLEKSLSGLSAAARGLRQLPRAVSSLEKLKISPELKQSLDKLADASAKLSANGKGLKDIASGISRITKISADADLDKKFASVAASVEKFGAALDKAITEDTLKKLERMGDALQKIKSAAPVSSALKAANKATAPKENKPVTNAIKWKAIEDSVQKINSLLSSIGTGLYNALDATGIIQDFTGMSSAITSNIPVLSELTNAWRTEAQEIKNIVLSQSGIVSKAADLMLVKVTHLIQVLYSLAKLPFKSINLTKGLISLMSLPIKNFVDKVKSLAKVWKNFVASLTRVAVYRAIRTALKEIASAIKEGVNNLYLWAQAWKSTLSTAEGFSNAMDTLATGVLYLKNALGAMVSPLIEYLAPAIDALIDRFVELTNVINQAIAALTGASLWRKAIRYPIEYGDVMDGAKKKADDLKRTVLGFDELNRLEDKNKKSGGSAKDDWDYSKMFEEVPVANDIKQMLESEDWSDIGTILASKINKSLASIDWTGIQENTRKWAKRFGTLFNQALLDVSMPLVGKSIAEFLNTIALGINTFYDQFDFEEFGRHLADGFESFVHNARWQSWGRAVTRKIGAAISLLFGLKDVDMSGLGSGVTDFVAGMFENIDVKKLAEAIYTMLPKLATEIGIALNGIFTTVNNKFADIDFIEFGRTIGNSFNNLFKNINPRQAGLFLSNALKGLIESIHGILDSVDWPALNEHLAELIRAMFENIDFKMAIQDAINLAAKIVELLNTAIENIPWEEVGDAIASADTTELVDGFKRLFSNVIDSLDKAGVLDDLLNGLGLYVGLKTAGGIGKLLPSFATYFGARAGAARAVASMGGGAAAGGGAVAGGGALSAALPYAFAGILGGWLGKKFANNFIGPFLEEIGNEDAKYYENFKFFGDTGFFKAASDFRKFFVEDLGTLWNNVFNNASSWISEMGGAGARHSFGEESRYNLSGIGGSAWDDWFHRGTTMFDGWVDRSDTMPDKDFGTMIDTRVYEENTKSLGLVMEGLIDIGNKINTILQNVTLSGEEMTNAIKNGLSSVNNWIDSNFLPGWNSAWLAVKESFGKILDDIADKLRGTSKDIGDSIGSIGEFIAGAFASVRNTSPSVKSLTTSATKVRKFAGGGMVGQGNLFIAGESGPELVTSWGNSSAIANADQLLDAISQGMAMAGGGDVTIPIYLDGNILDTVIVTAQQRQNMRSGGR